jgi:putative endonuclease
MRKYRYYVYMMQSTSRHALYIGVTSNLCIRVAQHKSGAFEGFTADYKCDRLVYYEIYDQVVRAISREKQLKAWRREKKERLIARMNPQWKDLSEERFRAETKAPSTAAANPAASARDDNPSKFE